MRQLIIRWRPAPLVLAVCLTACTGGKGGPGWGAGPVPVTVAKVQQKPMPVKVHAIGNVEAFNSVSVKTLVAGEIMEVHFTEGQNVKEGDLLFVIDPRPYRVALAQAQAALARDRALLLSARANARRNKELVGKEYVTAQQAEDSQAQADSLEATVASDEASVKLADLNLTYATIRSPISGKTGALLIHVGNVVKEKDLPLVVINQIQPIYVDFSLPDLYLNQLLAHAHERLSVTAVPGARSTVGETRASDSGAARTGELSFVDNSVNASSGTIALKAVFPNKDEALWPGQYVDVTMTIGERPDTIVAPAEAIQAGQEGSFVYVVKPDQTVESRPVIVGISDEREAAIEKGLSPGETVVTDGQLRLAPGSHVVIKPGAGSGT
jgi:membrane fusion protein, multidrug efflux system